MRKYLVFGVIEFPVLISDKVRTKWLEGEGYHVMRFWNNDVLENTDGGLFQIKEKLDVRLHPHPASPIKGEV